MRADLESQENDFHMKQSFLTCNNPQIIQCFILFSANCKLAWLFWLALFWFWLYSGWGFFICLFYLILFWWVSWVVLINTKVSIKILVIVTHFGLKSPREIDRKIYSIFYIISVISSALKWFTGNTGFGFLQKMSWIFREKVG